MHLHKLAILAAAVEKYLALRSKVAVLAFSAGDAKGKPVAMVKSKASSAQETDIGAFSVSSAAHLNCEKYQIVAGNRCC